jgi:hypothetical protein
MPHHAVTSQPVQPGNLTLLLVGVQRSCIKLAPKADIPPSLKQHRFKATIAPFADEYVTRTTACGLQSK